MAQWIQVLHVKADDLKLIPGLHIVEGENNSFKPWSAFQTFAMGHEHIHIKHINQSINQSINI